MSTTRTEKELEQELKNRGDEEKHDNFILAVRRKEMLTEEKMSGSKKKKANRNTYDISSIKRVIRKFHVAVVQNNS